MTTYTYIECYLREPEQRTAFHLVTKHGISWGGTTTIPITILHDALQNCDDSLQAFSCGHGEYSGYNDHVRRLSRQPSTSSL